MAQEHKGPNIEIPEELAEELAGSGEAGEAQAGGDAAAALAELAALKAEKATLQDRLLRMAAEHENQKRRWLREQQDLLNYAAENLVKELLPTVDNLERALDHARQAQPEELKQAAGSESAEFGQDATAGGAYGQKAKEVAQLLQGIELTYRSLTGVLERAGVEIVAAEGVEFNPRFHEAMRQIPSSEQAPNTVVEVYQRGYSLKGRLLRPALVAIAAPKSAE